MNSEDSRIEGSAIWRKRKVENIFKGGTFINKNRKVRKSLFRRKPRRHGETEKEFDAKKNRLNTERERYNKVEYKLVKANKFQLLLLPSVRSIMM